MLSLIHITTLDWIMVDIINFLPHHLIVLDKLRMHTFLPELIGAIVFVCFLTQPANLIDADRTG